MNELAETRPLGAASVHVHPRDASPAVERGSCRASFVALNNRGNQTRNGEMKARMGLFTLLLGCALATLASAQTVQGTGNNWGQGYSSDGNGNIHGTGESWGGGWESDGNGGYRGTGNNWGRGYRSDGNGGLEGTGADWGRGYRSDGDGGYQGTGDNWGRGYRSNGSGGLQGTGDNWGGGWQ